MWYHEVKASTAWLRGGANHPRLLKSPATQQIAQEKTHITVLLATKRKPSLTFMFLLEMGRTVGKNGRIFLGGLTTDTLPSLPLYEYTKLGPTLPDWGSTASVTSQEGSSESRK